MSTVYIWLFWIGVSFVVINTVLGLVLGFFDLPIDIDLENDFDLDIDAEFGFGLHSLLFFSPSLICVLITVMGGLGYILTHQTKMPAVPVFFLSLAAGYLAALAINLLVLRPMRRYSKKQVGSESDCIGLSATVIEPIFEDSIGKVSYTFDDNLLTAPARSLYPGTLAVGVKVVIVEIKNHVFYVEPQKPTL